VLACAEPGVVTPGCRCWPQTRRGFWRHGVNKATPLPQLGCWSNCRGAALRGLLAIGVGCQIGPCEPSRTPPSAALRCRKALCWTMSDALACNDLSGERQAARGPWCTTEFHAGFRIHFRHRMAAGTVRFFGSTAISRMGFLEAQCGPELCSITSMPMEPICRVGYMGPLSAQMAVGTQPLGQCEVIWSRGLELGACGGTAAVIGAPPCNRHRRLTKAVKLPGAG